MCAKGRAVNPKIWRDSGHQQHVAIDAPGRKVSADPQGSKYQNCIYLPEISTSHPWVLKGERRGVSLSGYYVISTETLGMVLVR